jgi:hypothetical protein
VRSPTPRSSSHLIVGPICEAGELRALGRGPARCESCGCLLRGMTLTTLQEMVGLPDALGSHACECGQPGRHRLPDGVFHCPACGSEVLPVETVPPSASPRTSASRTVAPSPAVEEVGSSSEGKGLDPR